ncbi:MAG: asparaginase [Lysobacterales bacterium]
MAIHSSLMAATPVSGDSADLPIVLVIATGGTIAGVQNVDDDPDHYRAGSLSAEQIVESVPELKRHARIESLQFSNVPSALITPRMWIALSRQIETALKERDDLAGVVVTHGTDRLEETAFFLYLTVRSDKPVVLVGAQQPATGVSPDGPQNLLDAVRTAASPEAVGKGALVVMDKRILSAREVRKLYQRVGGFSTGDMGMLGVVSHAGAEFFFTPARRHGSSSEFDLTDLKALPTVDLVYSYPGGTGPRYDVAPAGVVVSNTNFNCEEQMAFLKLARAGTIVVSAFPSGDNVARRWLPEAQVPEQEKEHCEGMDPGDWEGAWIPPIYAPHLTPQKARILLMLALSRTRDDLEIRQIFERY